MGPLGISGMGEWEYEREDVSETISCVLEVVLVCVREDEVCSVEEKTVGLDVWMFVVCSVEEEG